LQQEGKGLLDMVNKAARKKLIDKEEKVYWTDEIKGTTRILNNTIKEGKEVANDLLDDSRESFLPIITPVMFEVPVLRVLAILYSW
jgi:hypothetical protein